MKAGELCSRPLEKRRVSSPRLPNFLSQNVYFRGELHFLFFLNFTNTLNDIVDKMVGTFLGKKIMSLANHLISRFIKLD